MKENIVSILKILSIFVAGFLFCEILMQLEDKSPTGNDEFNDSEIIHEYFEQPAYTPVPDPIDEIEQEHKKKKLDDIMRLI